MTVLRIYLTADDACDWALYGPGDAVTAAGEDTPPGALPAADATELIVPAARMRTLLPAIPPVVPAKLPAVVRFAVEDQLAGDIEAQHIVVAARTDQSAMVHIVDRRWLSGALARLAQSGTVAHRAVAESDLVPHAEDAFATWIWRADGGFLVQSDTRVTVLDQSDDALPSALLLALADAPSGAVAVVRGPAEKLAARCADWSAATGVRFTTAPPWSWRDVSRARISAAPNLLTPDLALERPLTATAHPRRIWRTALWWLLAALLLHAGVTAAEWVTLNWRTAAVERDTRAVIAQAAPGLVAAADTDLVAAWHRHYAAARHRAGRTAPDDALPLLALAAGALRDLPPGALRTINYESGQLTLDFDAGATAAVAGAASQWQQQGLAVLQAQTAGGVRVRVTQP